MARSRSGHDDGMAFVFIGILVVILAGIAWSYYTRRGLGIAAHPTDGRGEAPGADRPATVSEPADDQFESTISSRGTR